ncbi:MAG: hypothetical protein MJ249_02825 [Kiritimatiellae bacterium]|nr:hypothetical protein [Kiritimatiellia bacterium]
MKKLLFTGMVALAGAAFAANTIRIDAAKVKCACAPDLWGIFFEDIDLSLDGGVYAELVRNRSFEDNAGKAPDAQKYWNALGGAQLAVTNEKPHSQINAHSLKVVAPAGGAVANEGYFGVAARKGIDYRLSFDVRGEAGTLEVSLESQNGQSATSVAKFTAKGGEWKTCKATLKGLVDDPDARLVFRTTKGGTFYLDCVTLFPSDTYGKSGLFRKDLMEKLAGLKPSFVRFPGGCWVEGNTMATAYRWKKTIGSIWERPTQWNIWGYWSTHGVGFHEYLQICEELNAKALFCINVGMSHREIVPMEKMDEFVQDALDCIEYANGPVSTRWGAERAKNGHPAPFNLAYLQIGNENGGPRYEERYERMAKAVHAKYPDIKIIFDGPWSGRKDKDTWDVNAPKNFRDDHFYRSPDWFFYNDMIYANAKERRLGKRDFGVFVGEYAVTSVGRQHPFGTLRAAIGEACFMTGMENCADVVKLAAYAPLFAHVKHLRWKPDLIYVASGSSFVNPSYDVQKLFSENRGRDVLTTVVEAEPLKVQENCTFGVGTWSGAAAFKDFKVTDATGRVLYANSFADAEALKGWKAQGAGQWSVKDGTLVQSFVTKKEGAMTLTLDRVWPDEATCSFKAKRLDGPEGFLALYASTGTGVAGNWVNFGGWKNKEHGIEGRSAGRHTPGTIECDRWYDVTVTRKGGKVSATIDGVKLPEGGASNANKSALLASAVTSPDGKEIIVKVVNFAERPLVADVVVANAKLANTAKLTTYTGPHANASNSLENPNALKPVTTTIAVGDGKLQREFPALSLSVICIPRR